jgi:hypothetical protein
MYKNALNNIQLALDNGYPQDKIENLLKRKQKCERLLDENKDKYMREKIAPEVFKLSYKPNPKLPFLADCLELVSDETGYHVKTKRDLKTGDVVAIEEPFSKTSNIECHSHDICINCLDESHFDLMPCDECTRAMFCSEKCREEAMRKFHKYECKVVSQFQSWDYSPMRAFFEALDAYDGNMENLMSAINNNSSPDITIFDFDLSKDDEKEVKKKMILAIIALATTEKIIVNQTNMSENKDRLELLMTLYNYTQFKNDFPTVEKQNFIREFAQKLHRIRSREHCGIVNRFFGRSIGVAFCPFTSLINHSCAPNVLIVRVNAKNYVTAKRAIKAGTELTTFFFMNHLFNDLPTRQHYLKSTFGIDCKCEACIHDYKLITDLETRQIVQIFAFTLLHMRFKMGDHELAPKSYKYLCQIMDHAKDEYPSKENGIFFGAAIYLLNYLSSDRYAIRALKSFKEIESEVTS